MYTEQKSNALPSFSDSTEDRGDHLRQIGKGAVLLGGLSLLGLAGGIWKWLRSGPGNNDTGDLVSSRAVATSDKPVSLGSLGILHSFSSSSTLLTRHPLASLSAPSPQVVDNGLTLEYREPRKLPSTSFVSRFKKTPSGPRPRFQLMQQTSLDIGNEGHEVGSTVTPSGKIVAAYRGEATSLGHEGLVLKIFNGDGSGAKTVNVPDLSTVVSSTGDVNLILHMVSDQHCLVFYSDYISASQGIYVVGVDVNAAQVTFRQQIVSKTPFYQMNYNVISSSSDRSLIRFVYDTAGPGWSYVDPVSLMRSQFTGTNLNMSPTVRMDQTDIVSSHPCIGQFPSGNYLAVWSETGKIIARDLGSDPDLVPGTQRIPLSGITEDVFTLSMKVSSQGQYVLWLQSATRNWGALFASADASSPLVLFPDVTGNERFAVNNKVPILWDDKIFLYGSDQTQQVVRREYYGNGTFSRTFSFGNTVGAVNNPSVFKFGDGELLVWPQSDNKVKLITTAAIMPPQIDDFSITLLPRDTPWPLPAGAMRINTYGVAPENIQLSILQQQGCALLANASGTPFTVGETFTFAAFNNSNIFFAKTASSLPALRLLVQNGAASSQFSAGFVYSSDYCKPVLIKNNFTLGSATNAVVTPDMFQVNARCVTLGAVSVLISDLQQAQLAFVNAPSVPLYTFLYQRVIDRSIILSVFGKNPHFTLGLAASGQATDFVPAIIDYRYAPEDTPISGGGNGGFIQAVQNNPWTTVGISVGISMSAWILRLLVNCCILKKVNEVVQAQSAASTHKNYVEPIQALHIKLMDILGRRTRTFGVPSEETIREFFQACSNLVTRLAAEGDNFDFAKLKEQKPARYAVLLDILADQVAKVVLGGEGCCDTFGSFFVATVTHQTLRDMTNKVIHAVVIESMKIGEHEQKKHAQGEEKKAFAGPREVSESKHAVVKQDKNAGDLVLELSEIEGAGVGRASRSASMPDVRPGSGSGMRTPVTSPRGKGSDSSSSQRFFPLPSPRAASRGPQQPQHKVSASSASAVAVARV